MPKIGEQAPDFELPNQDGKKIKLSDFRGQNVVLFAFPKADTPGCTAQACHFRDALPQMETNNAVVLGISPDAPQALKKFKTGQKLNYDLLSDSDHRVLEAWDAWGPSLLGVIKIPAAKRSYWVIDEHGIIIDMKVGVGPQESMEKALQSVENAKTVNI